MSVNKVILLGNVGADQGLDAHGLHLFAEFIGIDAGLFRPAVDGNFAIFNIHANGHFLAVFFNGSC